MRLGVVYSDRPSCYAALHSADAAALFTAVGTSRHFCRAVSLDRGDAGEAGAGGGQWLGRLFVGWVGDAALAPGTLEIARPFAACLGLSEGEQVVAAAATDLPVASRVMVQPHSVDDWEVVELQAGYIEEHLLAQVAVLAPGMVFPVWIHGQMPVKLRVDPKDSNQAECFLLDRNSEFCIESKKRASAAKAVSIFGDAASKAQQQPELEFRLRVYALSSEIDTPVGRVHPEELERIVGYVPPTGCLVWLACNHGSAAQSKGSGTSEGGSAGSRGAGAAGPSGHQLFHLEASAGVPRKHVVMGACHAEHLHIPCFSLVRVWRCRQVPVYVPHVELVPLSTSSWFQDHPGRADTMENASWLIRQFGLLVQRAGELELMDGAVVQLRSLEEDTVTAALENGVGGGGACTGPDKPQLSSQASSNAETDLYDGLSDIDDIYQTSKATSCEVIYSDLGIFEVDLGLDEDARTAEGDRGGMDAQPAALPEPPSQVVPVCLRFAMGGARAELRNAQTPPFVRISSRTLEDDLTVKVAWPDAGRRGGGGADGVAERGPSAERAKPGTPPSTDQLGCLWAGVPGLSRPSDEAWTEIVRLVPGSAGSTPLDGLKLFTEPAAALRGHILAQLGCLPDHAGSSAGQARGDGTNRHVKLPDAALDSTDPSEQTAQLLFAGGMPGHAVPGGVAVLGPVGAGKTTLCRHVCANFARQGVLPLEVACARLGQPSRKFKVVQDWLRDIFRFACWYSPTIILLDDLAALCPDVEQGAMNLSIAEERSPILAELLLDLLPDLRTSRARVAFVATLPDDAALHRTLRRLPAIEHKVLLRPPQLKERPEILQIFCQRKADAVWDVDEVLLKEGALDEWGGRVDGFSVADLDRLVECACVEATVDANAGLFRGGAGPAWQEKRRLAQRHLERACQDFVPATMTDQTFFASSVQWSEVGGLKRSKQELLDMLTTPTKYAILIDRAPIRTSKGLILVGPPGCGKTMLVHAAANETKGLLRFLTVKGPELLSKYIGASEAGVRQVFERAAAAAPSVIFFDEIEALTPKRGADSTGVTDRVVNQMLCYLDGVEDRGRVFVIAATSRPDLVDAALMRPGRFDKICYCGLPSDEEKLEICEILATKHGLAGTPSAAELRAQLQRLVASLPRLFTAADLNALFSSAKIEAVNETMRGAISKDGAVPPAAGAPKRPSMTMVHLFAALSASKASISEADYQRYAKIFAPYHKDKDANPLHRDGSDRISGVKVALA